MNIEPKELIELAAHAQALALACKRAVDRTGDRGRKITWEEAQEVIAEGRRLIGSVIVVVAPWR